MLVLFLRYNLYLIFDFRVYECKSGVCILRAGVRHQKDNTFLHIGLESPITHSDPFSYSGGIGL